MKKVFFVWAVLAMCMAVDAADCQDGPYGIQVNGTAVTDAPKIGDKDLEGRVQYMAACVELKVGDVVKLINQSCGATWMVNLDQHGEYTNFDGGKDANQLTCKVAGKYDFYIKMKEKDDLLYVENSKSCGGGVTPGVGVVGNPRYYYKMYTPTDQQWYEPSESTLFDHGVAEVVDYTGPDAYVFVLYQVDGQPGAQFFTEQYVDETHSEARFVPEAQAPAGEKWRLPAGATTLYLCMTMKTDR